jgi:hypothetical protein
MLRQLAWTCAGVAVVLNGRAYFDVPVPTGASYRVEVVSFEFVELEHS